MSTDVKILTGTDTTLTLRGAILCYEGGSQVYATMHDIVDVAHRPQLGPGRPLSKADLAAFADSVAKATAFRGMVPAELLYTAPNIMAWWRPAALRTVWFDCAEKEIGKASAKVMHPPLVFIATAGDWYVYALTEHTRPHAGSKLYKAPYFNVWASGSICTGNVELPQTVGPESIAAYEDAFFRSRFTHSNDRQLVRYKGGANALWRDQLAHPDRLLLAPPHLRARKETLEQAITRIEKDRS